MNSGNRVVKNAEETIDMNERFILWESKEVLVMINRISVSDFASQKKSLVLINRISVSDFASQKKS